MSVTPYIFPVSNRDVCERVSSRKPKEAAKSCPVVDRRLHLADRCQPLGRQLRANVESVF